MSEKGHIVHSQNSKTVQQVNTWKKMAGGIKLLKPKEH